MGWSEDCVSHGHTHKGRDWHFLVCAKRSRIQHQNLETNTLHYLGILECLSSCTLCVGAFQQLACSCYGVSLFCSVSCPLPSRVSFSIPRFWAPAAPGSEPSLLGKASSFSSTWQDSSSCSFPCSLLISLINGNLYFRKHFSFLFPIHNKLFYLRFSSIQCIRQNPESILTQESCEIS